MVTGNAEGQRDEVTLKKFARDVTAPHRVLHQLRPDPHVTRPAPAWPLTDEPSTLRVVLESISSRDAHPDTDWVTRLRLRRLAFVAVLFAPVEHDGLALTRGEVHDLTPVGLQGRRDAIV